MTNPKKIVWEEKPFLNTLILTNFLYCEIMLKIASESFVLFLEVVITFKNIHFSLVTFFHYSNPLGIRGGSDKPGPCPIAKFWQKQQIYMLKAHIAKIQIDQKCKIHLQILDIWCKNVGRNCRDLKKIFYVMSFF